VRRDCGMFDVSHMCVVDLRGERVGERLRRLLANDVAKLAQRGTALYSCMLREHGGVIDDLIVYYMDDRWYRMVVNAGTRDKDLQWLLDQAGPYGVTVEPRTDLAMIAVQGPNARQKAAAVMDRELAERALQLGPFFGLDAGERLVARTGYTGEDGFEIMLPAKAAPFFWQALLEAGVKPCGLGARDTLRLEAGMNLYGQDMDETITPWEAGLGWTVSMDDGRDFIGRAALQAQRDGGVGRAMVGIVMDEKGVLRHGQAVLTENGQGEILSGTFSPTLGKAIAFARIPAGEPGSVRVDIRGREVPVRVVKVPFVREGQAVLA
ncbi:MAG: glycine cleavage system aminomethyltransferase GcvT, partial [Dokdonella sp.]